MNHYICVVQMSNIMAGHDFVTGHYAYIFNSYSVADSMRFIFAKMKTPARIQMAMRTTQIDQRGILIQRRPGTDTR